MRSDALHPDFAVQLAALMEMTDRDGYVAPRNEKRIPRRILTTLAIRAGE